MLLGNNAGSERQRLRNTLQQPIVMAVQVLSAPLVKFFIEQDADVNWINSSYETPLDIVEHKLKEKAGNLYVLQILQKNMTEHLQLDLEIFLVKYCNSIRNFLVKS
jgi:hypothetical protein